MNRDILIIRKREVMRHYLLEMELSQTEEEYQKYKKKYTEIAAEYKELLNDKNKS